MFYSSLCPGRSLPSTCTCSPLQLWVVFCPPRTLNLLTQRSDLLVEFLFACRLCLCLCTVQQVSQNVPSNTNKEQQTDNKTLRVDRLGNHASKSHRNVQAMGNSCNPLRLPWTLRGLMSCTQLYQGNPITSHSFKHMCAVRRKNQAKSIFTGVASIRLGTHRIPQQARANKVQYERETSKLV